ncbi:MAG: cupin domain-containing protein [Cyanobacteriota bacterium]|nr:cupin domain-containing protein [Cyanobacteriota bacterium]
MSESPKIVRSEQLAWIEQSHSPNYKLRRKQLGAAAGNEKLGCSLYEVPPGCKSWPYHYHYANEEAIYVLAGKGTLRLNGEEIAIASGDYIAFPAGEISAHQMINTSDTPLRYLCFSTMIEPDITAYPDSNKIGVFAGAAPGGAKEKRTLNAYFPTDSETDYWDGEQ